MAGGIRLSGVGGRALAERPATGCEVTQPAQPTGVFVAVLASIESLEGDAGNEGVDQPEECSTVVGVQRIERFLDGRRPRQGDLAAECSTRRRQHDRQRSAVTTWSPLGEAGVDQPIDESHGSGVRQSCRLGEILGRATGKALAKSDEGGRRRARHPGHLFGGVADPVDQCKRERPDHVDEVSIA